MLVSKQKMQDLKDRAAGALAKARAIRSADKTRKIARLAGAGGAGAVAAGMADGVMNVLPGGFVGHSDFSKAPSPLLYKRAAVPALAAVALAYFIDGPESDAGVPILASMAGRGYAQAKATYFGVTPALTAEQLTKDIGAVEAAKVVAAKGYPAK